MPEYDPFNWFWRVGQDARVWSSAAGAYVEALPDGVFATTITSEQELNEVVAPYGLIGPWQHLQAYAADKRWRVETGGIVIAGTSIGTSRENQAMITGAVAYAQLNGDGSIDFKADTGWVALSSAEMIGIGQAVGGHVQACFAAEKAIDADIAAGTITTVAQIEVDPRWP